jgi:hypothetical protein
LNVKSIGSFATERKRGEDLVRVATKSYYNRVRDRSDGVIRVSAGIKPSTATLKKVTADGGGTAVVFERRDGSAPEIMVVTPVITHRSRPATPAQRAEALNGHGGNGASSLADVLAKAIDSVGQDAVLDALILATAARHLDPDLDLGIAAE